MSVCLSVRPPVRTYIVQSFVTYKRDGRRIDIDAEDVINHLKVGQISVSVCLFMK